MRRAVDFDDVKVAVSATAGAAAVVGGTKIDGTGFGRARFLFAFGDGSATTAAVSAGMGIWQASTSGATFAEISGSTIAAVTSGAISGNALCLEIDVPISSGTPWLLVSGGSMLSTASPHSCVCQLYHGVKRPPSSSSLQQTITV